MSRASRSHFDRPDGRPRPTPDSGVSHPRPAASPGNWILPLLLAIGWAGPIASQAETAAPEYNVKAGYLLLFTRYVQWPDRAFASPDAPLIVTVLGADPFAQVLDRTFRGMTSQGRKVEVRRARSPEEARGSQVVYIGRAEADRQAEWLAALGKIPVLSVTETEDGAPTGSIINFVMDGSALRFDVDLMAMKRAGLQISSPMMVSAREIRRDPGGR